MLLPELIEGPNGLLLRRWSADDAAALSRAITASIEHLRPWMAWVKQEPVPLSHRIAMIELWDREWRRGGDAVLGVFLNGQVAGGCGLHRRVGPNGLELGYWSHGSFLRQGLATKVAAALTEAALALPSIDYVEIHHDKANTASAGVPRKLGFRLIGEQPDKPQAPAESGIECRWRMDEVSWQGPPRGQAA